MLAQFSQLLVTKNIKILIMKAFGTILTLLGLIGVILFGIQAANNSETFSFLGLDVAVSEANWTPVIVSGVISVIGIIILLLKKGK